MGKLIREMFETFQWLAALVALVIVIVAFVTYLTAQAAIQVVAPIVVYFVGGAICLGIALWFIDYATGSIQSTRLKLAEGNKNICLARNAARQSDNETRLSGIEVQSAELRLNAEYGLLGAQVGQMNAGAVYLTDLGEARFGSHTSSLAKLAGKSDGVPLLENMPDLMSHIADCANLLVIGGKGSGKTTLLQHLEAERIRQGKILVLDSHAQPSQWQSEVIGIGRDYGQIQRAMVSIVNLLDKRYKTFATGQKHFELIWSIVDEFTLLPRILKDQLGFDVKSYSYPILTEGRKVGLNCIWGSHSDRAEALGLQGAKDLIECFDVVVYLKSTNRGHYALCDFGEGKQDIRYRLPGPFVIQGQAESVDDSETKLLVDDMPTMEIPDPIPNDEEKLAIVGFRTVARSGEFSWNKATQAAFGESRVGKNYHNKLRRILDKFSVDYSGYVSR